MSRKKIVWVTPDDFMDTDFNPGLLSLLLKEYEIKWIVIFPKTGARFKEADFNEFNHWEHLKIEFIQNVYRQRDPRRILFYNALHRRISADNYDLLYFNLGPSDPYILPLIWSLPKHKTIFAVHEGNINDNFKMPMISKVLLNATYSFAKFVHMFSALSAVSFQKQYPKTKITTTAMPLKSFGESKVSRPVNSIVFLVFGIISYAKNIELLIDAACNLYDQGYRNFIVSINGSCANWDFYQSRIRHPEIFRCDIRIVENSEIPDLFNSSHYLVQPYRSTSQSGVMKIAMNYNVPIIASDLPGLKMEIAEDVNGYLFKAGDIKDLEKVLVHVLNEHRDHYPQLLERMQKYTRDHYGESVLNQQFLSMIKEVELGRTSAS